MAKLRELLFIPLNNSDSKPPNELILLTGVRSCTSTVYKRTNKKTGITIRPSYLAVLKPITLFGAGFAL